jgi:3-phosphoshikimate 1-carboxyvinyltransferase
LLVPDASLTLTGVGTNPTRTGLLDVLVRMGAHVEQHNRNRQGGEPVADLAIRSSQLHSTVVAGDTVVRMIDEFPIFAVAATQAHGETLVRDASELRVKESDRIGAITTELRKMGAQIEEREDGFVVSGPTPLRGTHVHSHGDHRLAMALAMAGLLAEGNTIVDGAEVIADSFPGFVTLMRELGAEMQ